MTATSNLLMNHAEFRARAINQPGKWELIDGVPVAMSPKRVTHGDTNYRVARAFDTAIEKARAPCRFVLNSALVPIDKNRSFQPDVMVYCGPKVRVTSSKSPIR